MTQENLKNLVKQSLRVTTDKFDTQIDELITQAQADITASCNHEFNIDSPDERNMVVLYCKGLFGEGDEKSWKLYEKRMKLIGVRKQ